MSIASKAKKVLLYLPWLILIPFGIYLAFFEGWQDLTDGRMHRKAQESFLKVMDIDWGDARIQPWNITEARIYLLMGEASQKTSDRFSNCADLKYYPVYGSVTLTGKELATFLESMEGLETSYSLKTMCRPDPAYGFQLFDGKTLRFETAICWECGEVYIDYAPIGGGWYGFNAREERAKRLLEFCDTRLPYKRRVAPVAPLPLTIPNL